MLALMGSHIVVLIKPVIKVLLQFFNGKVNLFTKGYIVEFLKYGLMEALADTIALW